MSDSVNMRELAADILLEVTDRGAYSSILLRDVLNKYRYLPRRERAFLTRLVYGTLERLLEMDVILDQFSNTKVKKMKPFIRSLLRMSVYQLKYMDAVPASAVCSEAVKLAEKRGFGGLKGFVNGVLRNISRNPDAVVYPDPEKEPVRHLSVTCSVPEWIISMWEREFGMEETKAACAAFLDAAPLTVRPNLSKISEKELKRRLRAEGVSVRECRISRNADARSLFLPAGKDIPSADKTGYVSGGEDSEFTVFSLSGYDTLEDLASFKEGLFFVQDLTSILAIERAGIRPGDVVLDLCAAPGGKALHAAQKAGASGFVEARDLSEAKTDLIEENIARSGLTKIRAVRHDARTPDESWRGLADVVIADLPCTGLGVLGRKPEIRYRIQPEDIENLAALQREILAAAQEYVKPGGCLLYSTCTLTAAENRENAAWFAEHFDSFAAEYEEQLLPRAGVHDGFFFSKFVRVK